jgi:serine/threonine protein kinase
LEQIQGLGTDARSDIYALGATLYHLMTGVKPPDALTRAAALVNGQPDPLVPANEVSASIGPQVASVLARAMSQNREQRFATAAEMRSALKETGEAATLTGRSEAATVIFDAPPTTKADPSRRPQQTGHQAGETTVLRPKEGLGKSRFSPWASAAAAVVLMAVLFGAFYAYQHRNNSAATTPPVVDPNQGGVTAQPSPTTSDNATHPTAGALKDEKAAETSARAAETAKKSEKVDKKVDKIIPRPLNRVTVPAPSTQAPTPSLAERNTYPQNPPAHPNVPDMNFPTPSEMRGRGRKGGGMIRNLPDGTQVFTGPDGTRMVILPNGTRRVFRPGERPLRRRGLR